MRRPHAASSYSLGSSNKRSTFFAADFAAAPVRPSRLEQPAERLVCPMSDAIAALLTFVTPSTTVCVNCRNNNVLVSETTKLKCCHRMCHSCLRKIFTRSLADPQHMPPRCCTDEIPLKYVDRLFDSNFMKEWHRKYRESPSKIRINCPSRACGEPMKPEDMRLEGGRWQGRCSQCRTKVCGACGGPWHHASECPAAGETAHLPELRRRESWSRCRRCKNMVEIRNGRNHVIW